MSKNARVMEGQMSLFDMPGAAFGQEQKQPFEEAAGGGETAAAGFAECLSCWCRDCRHNAVNEAVPRQMCGREMACPACDGCVAKQKPDICIIGSAEEGCRVRALEEGIGDGQIW